MVNIVKHDLEFILKQIKIAERHAAGEDLHALVAEAGGVDPNSPASPQIHLLPYGLRTVDGSYNNLLPGREEWGAADQQFLPATDPSFREGSGTLPPGYPTNNDYGVPGNVVDAEPRLISNLIVDQTLDNPAAIVAALEHAGVTGLDQAVALQEIRDAHTILKSLNPNAGPAYATQKTILDGLLDQYGIEMDGPTIFLPNVSPDIGDSASFSSIFTLFGQFFDHGLDLVAKGGNGTVFMPLSEDDPLYNPASPHTNFMVLTRATTGDGARNSTTPWVDQNQTYGSHASKQIFMREYEVGADGKPVPTGLLLEGAGGGLATWADVKAQARDVLGIELTDADVGNIPLIVADEYGNFIPGANGYPQVVAGLGDDGIFGTADDVLVEGNPVAPVNPTAVGAFRTGHAFLDDIAHNAVPVITAGQLAPDSDGDAGNAVAVDNRGQNTEYDDELLDAHFITGDGRGNENIGLTTIHHIFHGEHNRMVEETKRVAIEAAEAGDLAFLNEWLLVDVAEVPADLSTLIWDGERLFQSARFVTEMEYQHLVFEEFARKMQPDVDAFLFEPDPDINPAIFAEFANVVYRFGHSMLNETVDRVGADGTQDHMSLFDAFLNPIAYDQDGTITHEAAAGAILRGMSAQVGNEIDEFVTNTLRNQLLGIPLDLPAINIARGRDTGMPTLNEAREEFRAIAGGDSQLDPYTSWTDFALNLKNPASIVNFIAAYGTHELIAGEASIEGKRAAAMALVFGTTETFWDPIASAMKTIAPAADRGDFLNGTGAYADGLGGLNGVDLWMGGLAEKKMDFGGMLGSTFSFIFELQMENLQDGDRFYYLSRVQGLNILSELESNSLAKMALRNTDLEETGTAIPGDIFSRPDRVLYMDLAKQIAMTGLGDPTHDNPYLEAVSMLVDRQDRDGDGATDYIRYNGGEHVVIQGTDGDDHIVTGEGDDTIWGGDGNDRLEGGYGVDHVHGGAGDDIITNAGTDIGAMDFLHGEEGNDVIHGGSGLSLVFGNQGNDFLIAGPDGKTVMGGIGDDFIMGGDGMDFLLGEAGDDWMEGGGRFDTLAGENSELMFNSTIQGNDVLNGQQGDTDYDAEAGDDIMFQGVGIQRSNGMSGFDWAIHKDDPVAANSDLGIPIFANQEAFILRDRFDLVEGLSGWKHDDVLTGRIVPVNTRVEATGTAAITAPGSAH
ncbi:MAG: peroxidase family protein [Mesorhizobium sp.]